MRPAEVTIILYLCTYVPVGLNRKLCSHMLSISGNQKRIYWKTINLPELLVQYVPVNNFNNILLIGLVYADKVLNKVLINNWNIIITMI